MGSGPTRFQKYRNPARARRAAALVALALLFAGPAAGSPEHDLRDAVVTVIKNQMAAFRRGDGEAAFRFASPDLQDQFGSADAYLSKFATAYEAVYRPKAVTFLNLAFSRGRLVQRVLVVGPDERAVVALFPMVQMSDGSWRIDGCVLVPAGGKSAATDPEAEPVSRPEEIAQAR